MQGAHLKDVAERRYRGGPSRGSPDIKQISAPMNKSIARHKSIRMRVSTSDNRRHVGSFRIQRPSQYKHKDTQGTHPGATTRGREEAEGVEPRKAKLCQWASLM